MLYLQYDHFINTKKEIKKAQEDQKFSKVLTYHVSVVSCDFWWKYCKRFFGGLNWKLSLPYNQAKIGRTEMTDIKQQYFGILVRKYVKKFKIFFNGNLFCLYLRRWYVRHAYLPKLNIWYWTKARVAD